MDEINADLHRKLDRMELAPLRRYINSRLKNIMTKLNRLIAEDESPDACTTRRKIIRCGRGAAGKAGGQGMRGHVVDRDPVYMSRKIRKFRTDKFDT